MLLELIEQTQQPIDTNSSLASNHLISPHRYETKPSIQTYCHPYEFENRILLSPKAQFD